LRTNDEEKTICNISIVWEKNLQTGGGCGDGGSRSTRSCDAVLYIIPAVLDQMTTFPRNDSPIRSLRGTHRRLSLHLSAQHTHQRAGYFYRRPVYKRNFFFIHPLDVFAILLTFRLSKSKIIFNLFYLYTQAKLHH